VAGKIEEIMRHALTVLSILGLIGLSAPSVRAELPLAAKQQLDQFIAARERNAPVTQKSLQQIGRGLAERLNNLEKRAETGLVLVRRALREMQQRLVEINLNIHDVQRGKYSSDPYKDPQWKRNVEKYAKKLCCNIKHNEKFREWIRGRVNNGQPPLLTARQRQRYLRKKRQRFAQSQGRPPGPAPLPSPAPPPPRTVPRGFPKK
jgi:hypothetical protein